MISLLVTLLASMGLATPPPANDAGQNPSPAAQSKPGAKPPPEKSAEKVVCRTDPNTGSMIAVKVCKTEREWGSGPGGADKAIHEFEKTGGCVNSREC